MLRRLLLAAGFMAVALSPVLGLRLWPLAFAAVALWLALGYVAERLEAARRDRPRRAQRPDRIEALNNLLPQNRRRR